MLEGIMWQNPSEADDFSSSQISQFLWNSKVVFLYILMFIFMCSKLGSRRQKIVNWMVADIA